VGLGGGVGGGALSGNGGVGMKCATLGDTKIRQRCMVIYLYVILISYIRHMIYHDINILICICMCICLYRYIFTCCTKYVGNCFSD